MDDGGGVGFDKSFRNLRAADFSGGIASRRKDRDALLGVVSVGGEHVDGIVLKKPVRGAAAAVAPKSGERRSG